MADEEIGEAEALLQLDQQVQHLRLHGDVERRDRLVEHQDLRPQHQRARDGDALALAAREHVRIAIGILGAQADALAACRARPRGGRAALISLRLMHQRLGQRVDDLLSRIERAIGVLEHDLHVGAQRPASARTVGAWRYRRRRCVSVPAEGGSIIVTRRASVDLPQPDSPTTASVRPASSVKLASARRLDRRGACERRRGRLRNGARDAAPRGRRRRVHAATSRPSGCGWPTGRPCVSG